MAVVVPYFGTFGPWFPLFLDSLARQRMLDLLLVGDHPDCALPANVRYVPMTLRELRDRAETILRSTVRLDRPRKLCDLKPAYGLIFEALLTGYAYWAFGDEDVLYGALDRLLLPLLGSTDILVPSRTMTIGHLTILRNAPSTNQLATSDPVYRDVLASAEHWAYDESSWARPTPSSSFTQVVQQAEARGAVTVRWGFPKRGNIPWPGRSYVYEGGALRDNDGTEVTYYHWGRFRHAGFPFPSPMAAAQGFGFDRYGFFDVRLGPVHRRARQTVGRVREHGRRVRRVIHSIPFFPF